MNSTFMPNTKMPMPVQGLVSPHVAGQPEYEITDQDKKRVQKIQDAWKAYCGELDPPLQKMPGQPDDNVLTNRMMALVDQGVNFLFGKELEIAVEENAPQEAQQQLDAVWGRKEARIPLLQKLGMSGAMAGEAFLRIVPGNKGSYRLVVLDPSIVFVQTMPQDIDTVLLYCIEYCTNEKRNDKWEQVYYREEIKRLDPYQDGGDTDGEGDYYQEGYEDITPDGIDSDVTWQIQHWSRVGQRGLWTPAGEPIIWPYPFAPIFPAQNLPNPHDFWGIPDVTPDLIGINQALNLVQSNINRILKLYGSPILYATGTGEQVIDIKPGKIIGLPLTESKITAVTLTSDVANALAFASNLRSDIDEQSGVPGVATGRLADMPRGNISGIAIELMFMPLQKKTEKKQCTYGELIIDVSKALLVLFGLSGDIDMTLAWQSPIPHDDLPAVQAALAKKEISISNTTLQRELGYDPEEEMALNESESERKLKQFNTAPEQIIDLPLAVPGTKKLPGQEFPKTPGGGSSE